ncbi:hypothetical protein ES703_97698 [subsurface metagenome]
MAEIKEPKKVLLLIGLIFIKDFELNKVLNELKNDLGNILMKSNTIPFTHTIYYNKEMGDKLMRKWLFQLSFLKLTVYLLQLTMPQLHFSYCDCSCISPYSISICYYIDKSIYSQFYPN